MALGVMAAFPQVLTNRQREVLEVIEHYHACTGERCSVRFIARRLKISHQRVHQHLSVLREREWLEGTRPVRRP